MEEPMKAALALCFALAVPELAFAADTSPPHICISVSQIDHRVILNDQEIVFYMRGGKAWKNTLHAKCGGLKFQGGFAWTIRGDEVCANQQVIYVLDRGNPCMLGDFTPYTDPKAH